MPDEAEELRACQRYYIKWYNSQAGFIMHVDSYGAAASAYVLQTLGYPVSMRIAPAGTIGTGAGTNVASVSVWNAISQLQVAYLTVATGRAYASVTALAANARM
jgi:hypothetical protein